VRFEYEADCVVWHDVNIFPEDGLSMLLRKLGKPLTGCMVSWPDTERC
jgi:hypothetical protein